MMSLRHVVPLAVLALGSFRCAKPTDAESLIPPSGGYEVVGRLQTPGFAQDVVVRDTLAFVAEGEGGLAIVSIADPRHPYLIALCEDNVRGYSSKVALKDTTVYIAAGDFGVSVVNVANPATPYATAWNLPMKPARACLVVGDYMFTAVSEEGVKISDISYPTQPDTRWTLSTSGYARGLCVTPDSVYLLIACGEMGLAIHDIRDLRNGRGSYPLVSWTDTPGYAEDVITRDNYPMAFIACGTSGIYCIDYADSTNVRIVGGYATGGYAKEVDYRNGRLYVTTEGDGLQVLSVENASAPTVIGVVQSTYALGVALGQGYVYVADRNEGLLVIKMP